MDGSYLIKAEFSGSFFIPNLLNRDRRMERRNFFKTFPLLLSIPTLIKSLYSNPYITEYKKLEYKDAKKLALAQHTAAMEGYANTTSQRPERS